MEVFIIEIFFEDKECVCNVFEVVEFFGVLKGIICVF